MFARNRGAIRSRHESRPREGSQPLAGWLSPPQADDTPGRNCINSIRSWRDRSSVRRQPSLKLFQNKIECNRVAGSGPTGRPRNGPNPRVKLNLDCHRHGFETVIDVVWTSVHTSCRAWAQVHATETETISMTTGADWPSLPYPRPHTHTVSSRRPRQKSRRACGVFSRPTHAQL